MPVQSFECSKGHVTERKMSFEEIDAVPRDAEGRRVIECGWPYCGESAAQLFSSSHAVYNAHGFYGSLGTTVAHNCGTVH